MTNSRRRFLGLLGLFGLPTSVWAQTAEPAGPPQIVCEALLQATKDGYNVNFRRPRMAIMSTLGASTSWSMAG